MAKKKVKLKAKKSVKASKPMKAKAAKPKITGTSLRNFLSPLDDRLLVIVQGASDVTSGGIIIPGTVAEKPNRGEVIAKGPGRRSKKGGLRPLDVEVGDEVLFPQYAGTKISIENQECLILREEDLLGIVT